MSSHTTINIFFRKENFKPVNGEINLCLEQEEKCLGAIPFLPYKKCPRIEKDLFSAAKVLTNYLRGLTAPSIIQSHGCAEVFYYVINYIKTGDINQNIEFDVTEEVTLDLSSYHKLVESEAKKSVVDFFKNFKNESFAKRNEDFNPTICVPTFNRTKALEETLEAMANQSFKDFELIVVNDGSTSPDALKTHQHLKDKYFSSQKNWRWIDQENQYLGKTRNVAASFAKGSQLIFIDDDNIPQPHMMERYRYFWTRSKAKIFVSGFRIFNEKSPHEFIEWYPFTHPLFSGFISNIFADAQCLIEKDFFHEIDGYTTDRNIGFEDWELYLKLYLKKTDIFTIPEILYDYRVHENLNSMRNVTSNFLNHKRALRPLNESFPRLSHSVLFNLALYNSMRNSQK